VSKEGGKASAKKAPRKALMGWSEWAQQNEGVQQEESFASGNDHDHDPDIEQAGQSKRPRSKKVTLSPGFDEDGDALPTDDSSPYTKQQIHCWKKVLPTLHKSAQDKYFALCLEKDKSGLNMLVNSLIPKNATYSLCINPQKQSSWLSSVTKTTEEQVEKEESHGVTETEAIGICGSMENFQRGIKRGDCFYGKDLFFVCLILRHFSDHCSNSMYFSCVYNRYRHGEKGEHKKHQIQYEQKIT